MSNQESGSSTTKSDEPKSEWEINKEKAESELAALKADLEKQKLLANQQLELTKSQKDLIGGLLPKEETKPLEGKIETDDKSGFVAEQVAYVSTNTIASSIAKELGTKDVLPANASILIVNQLDFASGDLPLIEINTQFSLYETLFKNQKSSNDAVLSKRLLPEAIAPIALAGVSAIPGIISSIADIAAYFRTDYNIKGVEFTLKQEALVAAVASKLHTGNTKIYIENYYTLPQSEVVKKFTDLNSQFIGLQQQINQLSTNHAEPRNNKISQLQKDIDQLKDKKSKLKPETAQGEIDKINAQIVELEGTVNGLQNELKPINALIQDSKNLVSEFSTYSKAITTKAEGQTYPKLVQSTLREAINKLSITHLLYLGVLSSGGAAITMRNLFQRASVNYTGGAVVCYILADIKGPVIASNTLQGFSYLNCRLKDMNTKGVRPIKIEGR